MRYFRYLLNSSYFWFRANRLAEKHGLKITIKIRSEIIEMTANISEGLVCRRIIA